MTLFDSNINRSDLGKKAALRVHFKEWVTRVKDSNMAHRIPNHLLDELPESYDSLVIPVLYSLGLKVCNGYWETK